MVIAIAATVNRTTPPITPIKTEGKSFELGTAVGRSDHVKTYVEREGLRYHPIYISNSVPF